MIAAPSVNFFLLQGIIFMIPEGVDASAKRKILWDNCARLYRLPA